MSKPDMSAVAKVFTTVELLEAVLLELPMKDLFRTQQVRKHWKQVIAGSNAIQKALFMRPGSTAEAAVDSFRYTYIKDDGTTSEIAINPWVCDEDYEIFKNNDGLAYMFALSRRAIDSHAPHGGFALMSLTQPPIKLEMSIIYECGDETLFHLCRGKHVCHRKISEIVNISRLLRLIHSTSLTHARKLNGNDPEFVEPSIEVTRVWFRLRGSKKK
ncbi:hypothetical protein KC357_g3009 [Hortaea werneckii]|nr:hypothetical protein KC357_g3009 [Hortaea werneckii]